MEPGFYNFEDLTEALLKIVQPVYEGYHDAIDIVFDDVTMKTELAVRPGIKAITFDGNSVFSNILGFNPNWDYKKSNKCASQKLIKLSTTNKIHLNCGVINVSFINGVQQPFLFSFHLDKRP